MATLLLTAIGTAIGGPVGGAIGGLIGQAVDRDVLFPAKPRQGPRLTELQVQTSSYGTQIPKVFGRMRVAGCVIWATDLIEHRGSSRGGKGQAAVTSYSYSVSFAVALSARAIEGVGRIWADGRLLRGAGGDFKTATGFRLHKGGEDQAADPLIAAAENGRAPAHRGIAYAVFEDFALADYGNRIPSLTFEVIADEGEIGAGAVVAALSPVAVTVDGVAAPLAGYCAYGDTVRAVAEGLGTAAGAWFGATGDALAMTGAGAAPVATLADAGVDGARGARRIAPLAGVPRTLSLAHHDPARDWQAGVQQASRPGAGHGALRIDLPAALSADDAKRAVIDRLAGMEAARVTRIIAAGPAAMAVPPGAVVRIAGEDGAWRVTKSAVEGWGTTLTLAALSAPSALAVAGAAGRAATAPDRVAGATIVTVIEPPPLDETAPAQARVLIAATGAGAGWRRAALSYSLDAGASWIAIGDTAPAAVIGTLAAPLAAGPATLIDGRGVVDVLLPRDATGFESADTARIDRGANLIAIGDELLQFELATRIAPARWRLERLWRGRRASRIAAHPAGAMVTLLEADALVPLSFAAAPGATIRVMASGVGDAIPVEIAHPVSAAATRPPPPCHLAATALADGGLALRWVPRGSFGAAWDEGIDPDAAGLRYRVTIDGAQSWLADIPMLTLNAADAAGAHAIAIEQIDARGASRPAFLTLDGDIA